MKPPRIRSLELLTAAPLAAMKRFYHDAIGFGLLEDRPARLSLSAGSTRLTFIPAPPVLPGSRAPFYHFAFNIPENKIVAALRWQEARGPMLPIPPRNRDPRYPDHVVDYRHWNAHSVFFLDPGGNVVEYIARHDLDNGASGGFGTADILYASEIAFVVDDVGTAAAALGAIAGTGQYRGGSDQFMAVGDEVGLLLVMKRGRIIDFSETNTEMAVTVFPTRATITGPQPGGHAIAGFPYEIACEERVPRSG
jgi:catechol 2,3-dioxygenase-like lactoylglutathione lyase family enzyme